MNQDLLAASVCQEFGWTYQEYMNTPKWFVDLIVEKMMRDAKELEIKSKRRG